MTAGVIKLASTQPKSKGGISTAAIIAIVAILVALFAVIIGVILYRYCSGRYGRMGDSSGVRYELGDDSGEPGRLTALKYKIRSGSRGTRGAANPMEMYDDSRPFADHDTL